MKHPSMIINEYDNSNSHHQSHRVKSNTNKKSYGRIREDMSESKLQKKGMCYKCGEVRTHRIIKKTGPFASKVMEPLTIEGLVLDGCCLACHTINSTERIILSPKINTSNETQPKKQHESAFREKSKKSCSSGSSSLACAGSVGTQPTYSSAESTLAQQQGKPPLQPRSRTTKDFDLLDYSSAEDENSVFDCGSSISSNSCRRLRLTQSEDSIELALPKDPDTILRDMKDHPTDATVIEFGCAALGQLKAEQLHGISSASSSSTTTAIPITASTVIEVILSAILLHRRNVRIVEESVRTLRRLTFKPSKCENTANVSIDKRHLEKGTCARIERHGGIRLIVNILKDYPNHRKIQFDCLRIVRNILSCLEVSESTATSYIDHDALEAIIQTMLKHGECKAVQEDGCALLWMLAFNNNLYQMKIAELMGIQAILEAMATQKAVEQVHYQGCGALHVLSCNNEIKAKLLDAGALTCIFRSMEEHGYSPLVSEKSCSALAALMVRRSGETKLCILQKTELASIIRLMTIHSSSRRVQKSALKTLELAARAKSNLAILKTCKPLRSVIRAAANAFPDECSRSAGRLMSALDNR